MMASRRVLIVIATLALSTFSIMGCGGSSDSGGSRGSTPNSVTTLRITNTGSSSVTLGFVNAAVGMGGACPSANSLLTAEELSVAGWCTDFTAGVHGAGKCKLTLGPAGGGNDSVTVPNPHGKCISGTFGTGGFAACGTPTYPHGWTQGEFTLNPTATDQEVVDISGVNGINYAVSISLGTGWHYGAADTSITTVGPNGPLNSNVGNPGVYPNGCTDCIQLQGAPVCSDLTSSPTCQASRICNIKRDNSPGGTVEFKIGDLL